MSKISVSIKELAPLIIEQLDKGSEVAFTITGNSMYPFYYHQKTVVTLVKPLRPYRIGDAIFCKDSLGHYILHRIIGIDEVIFTQGDALRTKEMVHLKDIYGVVTSLTHFGRTIDVNKRMYRFKIKLWMHLVFIRRYLLFINRKLSHKNMR